MEIDLKSLEKSELPVRKYLLLQMIHEEGVDPNNYDWEDYLDDLAVDLESKGYIKILGSGDERIIELRQKAVELFGNNKDNVADWIEQWCSLWPKGVKSGGYYLKPNKQDALSNMQKFVKKYKFTKEQIFEATGNYLKEKERDNWAYCMLGSYFIMKNNMSQLANYCGNLGVKEKELQSLNKMI